MRMTTDTMESETTRHLLRIQWLCRLPRTATALRCSELRESGGCRRVVYGFSPHRLGFHDFSKSTFTSHAVSTRVLRDSAAQGSKLVLRNSMTQTRLDKQGSLQGANRLELRNTSDRLFLQMRQPIRDSRVRSGSQTKRSSQRTC